MRQFRTCTDSVFDLDTDVEDPGDLALVTQAGPPPQEVTDPPAVGAPADTAT
jgi:hypothetical protein